MASELTDPLNDKCVNFDPDFKKEPCMCIAELICVYAVSKLREHAVVSITKFSMRTNDAF